MGGEKVLPLPEHEANFEPKLILLQCKYLDLVAL
jgi:hypothetical protein